MVSKLKWMFLLAVACFALWAGCDVYQLDLGEPLNPGFSVMHRVKTNDREVRAMAKYLKSW